MEADFDRQVTSFVQRENYSMQFARDASFSSPFDKRKDLFYNKFNNLTCTMNQ